MKPSFWEDKRRNSKLGRIEVGVEVLTDQRATLTQGKAKLEREKPGDVFKIRLIIGGGQQPPDRFYIGFDLQNFWAMVQQDQPLGSTHEPSQHLTSVSDH